MRSYIRKVCFSTDVHGGYPTPVPRRFHFFFASIACDRQETDTLPRHAPTGELFLSDTSVSNEYNHRGVSRVAHRPSSPSRLCLAQICFFERNPPCWLLYPNILWVKASKKRVSTQEEGKTMNSILPDPKDRKRLFHIPLHLSL